MVLRFVLLIPVTLLMTCVSSTAITPDYTIIEEMDLPQELIETSALHCPDIGSAYTVNDSGNKPIIYTIDSFGRIISQRVVVTKNIDWEALTGDSSHFYIGDIGNNNGKRKFVQIHAVAKNDAEAIANVTTIKLRYKNNSIKKNEYLNHDFDAETLINVDDSLFLFSKSWKSGVLFIYQLNKNEYQQSVEHIGKVEGLSGIITGGDFDSKNNRFILVGYAVKGLGSFYPFITILNKDFSLRKSFELSGYGQVEGVCVTPTGEVWFTQEGSFLTKHKLIKLDIAE